MREALLQQVWGYEFRGDTKVVDVYVGYLRQKLAEPRLIQTVRGVGYALRAGE
jgi:two-component system, OmpR family, response regulator MprA